MTSTYMTNFIKEFVKRYKTDDNDVIIFRVFDTFGNMIGSYADNYKIEPVEGMLIITEHDEYSTQVKCIDIGSITRIDMTIIPAALYNAKRPSF